MCTGGNRTVIGGNRGVLMGDRSVPRAEHVCPGVTEECAQGVTWEYGKGVIGVCPEGDRSMFPG